MHDTFSIPDGAGYNRFMVIYQMVVFTPVVFTPIFLVMHDSSLTFTGLEGHICPSLVKGLEGHICPSVVTSWCHHCDVI